MNLRNIVIFTIAILTISSLFSCKSSKKTKERSTIIKTNTPFGFAKSNDIYELMDIAKKENKLLFVDVYTDWCLPCKVMDEEVFNDKELGEYFQKHFITYKVNAEKENGPDINTIFGIGEYPTMLFLDQNGRELERLKGLTFHDELKQVADSARNKASQK